MSLLTFHADLGISMISPDFRGLHHAGRLPSGSVPAMVLPVCGDLAGTRRPGRHSIRSLSIGCYAARGVANAGALLAVLFLTAPLVLKAFAAGLGGDGANGQQFGPGGKQLGQGLLRLLVRGG